MAPYDASMWMACKCSFLPDGRHDPYRCLKEVHEDCESAQNKYKVSVIMRSSCERQHALTVCLSLCEYAETEISCRDRGLGSGSALAISRSTGNAVCWRVGGLDTIAFGEVIRLLRARRGTWEHQMT